MSTTLTLKQHTPKSGTIISIKRKCIALINRFNKYFIKSYYNQNDEVLITIFCEIT